MAPHMAEPPSLLDALDTDRKLTNTQHDAVLDYYGRRLATCSSDKTIKIFEVEGDTHRLVETLKGYAVSLYPSTFPPSPRFARD